MATGLSDERAARFMVAIREGMTPHIFGVTGKSLELYFAAHPDFANEARPLIEANAKAARYRKGNKLRTTTHCRAGLHLMTGENVYFDGTHGRRRCVACRKASSMHASLMSDEVAEKVKRALKAGASLGQITKGKPLGGGRINRRLVITTAKNVRRYRREYPDFDHFVTAAIDNSRGVGLRIHFQRKLNATKKEEANDYYKIRAMLPSGFPDKDDVVSDIFEALLDGSLRREDVKARVSNYVTAHNRMFPTKYAKFGDSPLVSLDQALFDDGSTTRGDTISRGLWD
jgi:hypothetical protein